MLHSPSPGTRELQIPGLENPWAEVTPCESGQVSAALARRAGDEAGAEVSTTSPRAAAAREGMFPMTAIPTLLSFSFLLIFPCAESFLKESQEGGDVPSVTLAGVTYDCTSQTAKGFPGKSPHQPNLLLRLLGYVTSSFAPLCPLF